MALPLTIDAVTYDYPEQGDVGYAAQATNWAQAATNAIAAAETNITTLQTAVTALQTKAYIEYTSTSGQSFTTSLAAVVDFANLVHDTSGLVTTGASWHFTAPRTGNYVVAVNITFNTTGTTANTRFYLGVLVNGVEAADLFEATITPPSSTFMCLAGSTILYLAAGDTVAAQALQGSGSGKSLMTTPASKNRITIKEVE